MPYSKPSEAPDYVPEAKRAQWIAVWNSAYKRALEDGKSKEKAEESAFAQANGVAGPNSDKMAKASVGYEEMATGDDHCNECHFFESSCGVCINPEVQADPDVPVNARGQKTVSPDGWCRKFVVLVDEEKDTHGVAGPDSKEKVMKFKKFIPFVKVDETLRQVWGIVTAELPDKDDEICDYLKSKPYYEQVIAEMDKATEGENYFPLREMHNLSAVGKCIGFQFRDADKEIFMGFEVVDDVAWRKVKKNVYTGFSQGGTKVGPMVPDREHEGCMRYVANPSEISLVDNPCLAAAHFAYVKSDGSVEMRKYSKVLPIVTGEARLVLLEREVAMLKAAQATTVAKGKTKRVAGEDLPASAFAYVGDHEDTSTWKLPIKFSTDSKTKSHIRNALARFGQTQGIPADKKTEVYNRIKNAAKQHGIDVSDEKEKMAAIQDHLRKYIRAAVNRAMRTKGDVGHTLSFLDSDLGRLQKGMYEVSVCAQLVQGICSFAYQLSAEQEWEEDEDSALTGLAVENAHSMLDLLLAVVQEETQEMRADIDARVA